MSEPQWIASTLAHQLQTACDAICCATVFFGDGLVPNGVLRESHFARGNSCRIALRAFRFA